jgi:hemoglobin-like flavoprotein
MKSIVPDYYIENCIPTEDDIFHASKAWNKVMAEDNTKPFRDIKANDPTFEYSSSLTWFYDVFYARFFELCPQAKPFFAKTSMLAQGRLIAGVISSSLMAVKEPDQLRKRLTHMTEKHNGKGIAAVKYGFMGNALLDALDRVLGPEDFDALARLAWIRIYTFMLNIILPIVVDYELKEQEPRYNISNNTMFYKISRRLFAPKSSANTTNEVVPISNEQDVVLRPAKGSSEVLNQLAKSK